MRKFGRLHRAAVTQYVIGLPWVALQSAFAEPAQTEPPDSMSFETAAVRFDPATHRVTLTLPVQDSRGDYFPAARPENFVVYEDGTRQKDVAVEIQRSPVSLGVVLEYGGRYPSLNEAISGAVSSAVSHLVNDIRQEDTVAVWTYGDSLIPVSGFQRGREGLQHALQTIVTPPLSESNLCDALASALTQMGTAGGRKALLLISSGVDTFSQLRYEDLLARVRDSRVPIYVINLSALLQRYVSFNLASVPYSRLNWKHASSRLAAIAQLSGGHLYGPDSTLELAAVYDDLMESLRARYTLTYHSPAAASVGGLRTVRVELLDPKSGAPLMMADAQGRPVRANITIARTYLPPSETKASERTAG